MPCVSGIVESLGKRERLQDRYGLVLAENEAARAPHVTDYVHHFRLRHGDHVMRENLNVLLWIFGLHDFFQVEFGDAEMARGIERRRWQGDAAPRQFPSDTDDVPCVLPDSASQRQHLQQGLASLYLVNTRCVYCPENRDRLTPYFHDVCDHLRLTYVRAQGFVELLLRLLHGQPGHMDASH